MTFYAEIERRQGTKRVRRLNDEPPAPKGVYMMAVVPLLTFVHALLAWLVRLQYNQEVSLKLIASDAWPSIPIFIVLLWALHPVQGTPMQLAAGVASSVVGGYLVRLANEEGYYAVMKIAPPLGTLWTWMFMEMDWQVGTTSLLAVFAYTYFSGYSL